MKGASPNQQKNSVAIQEGVEKLKQRLEIADCKIQVLDELFQATRDKADAARGKELAKHAETKVAQAVTRIEMKRAEEVNHEIKEKDAKIAALE